MLPYWKWIFQKHGDVPGMMPKSINYILNFWLFMICKFQIFIFYNSIHSVGSVLSFQLLFPFYYFSSSSGFRWCVYSRGIQHWHLINLKFKCIQKLFNSLFCHTTPASIWKINRVSQNILNTKIREHQMIGISDIKTMIYLEKVYHVWYLYC